MHVSFKDIKNIAIGYFEKGKYYHFNLFCRNKYKNHWHSYSVYRKLRNLQPNNSINT